MKHRIMHSGLVAGVALLAAGWGVAGAAIPAQAATPRAYVAVTPVAMHMAPGMRMPDGTRMPAKAAVAGPSASARMVCSPEIRRDVATALALKASPSATATWSNHLYTCTYHLAGGPLVFSVKESGSVPKARTYLTVLRHRLAPTQPLQGAVSLGLPAYQTSAGNAVFLKDDKTLQVDATAMPQQIGPHGESRSTFAYQMATDVLGCWSGK
jgi:hypothetical protein